MNIERITFDGENHKEVAYFIGGKGEYDYGTYGTRAIPNKGFSYKSESQWFHLSAGTSLTRLDGEVHVSSSLLPEFR